MSLRTSIALLGIAVSIALQGCATAPSAPVAAAPVATTAAAATDTKQQLDALFENYFEDDLRTNPLRATYIGDHRYDDQLPNSIGPEYLAAAHAMNQKYLAAIRAIDPGGLSPADRISYDIFLYEREREARGERFPFHLLPINQAGSLLTVMPALGSGTNAQPFATVADYERWLKRLDGLAVWMDQAVVNMRQGAATGVVQPRAVMEKVLGQLDAMAVSQAQDSQYYAPIRQFPATFSAADRDRLTAEYTRTLDGTLLPAYQAPARFRARRIPAADAHQRCVDGAARRTGVVRLLRAGTHDDEHDARRDPRAGSQRGEAHPRRDGPGPAAGRVQGRSGGVLHVPRNRSAVLLHARLGPARRVPHAQDTHRRRAAAAVLGVSEGRL